jgi:membrane-bound lytic murein transglycosylase D
MALDWRNLLEQESAEAHLRHEPHPHSESFRHLQFDIPVIDHPLVDVYIDYFTGRGRWFFENWLARAARYIPIMQPILEAKGLPKDLVYLAMIESGFSARAISTAAACGYWQFIRSTGKIYGLQADMWIDERRDFIRATEAAADYLGELYKQFGNWHLAWAGYNAGDGRIRRAMAKYGASDFWTLIEHRNSLAKETKHYVPKIIAAAIVAKDRERYGFTAIQPESPLIFEEVKVADAIDLKVLAEKLSITAEQMRDLNPALLYDITPPGRTMAIRVPQGRAAEATSIIAELPVTERLTYAQHKVRKGDTLSVEAGSAQIMARIEGGEGREGGWGEEWGVGMGA